MMKIEIFILAIKAIYPYNNIGFGKELIQHQDILTKHFHIPQGYLLYFWHRRKTVVYLKTIRYDEIKIKIIKQ